MGERSNPEEFRQHMQQKADAQRLELIRERVKLPYFHTTREGKDDVCFLLSQLDAANQTIAYVQQAAQIMIDSRDKTVAEKDAEIYGWLDFERWVEAEHGVSAGDYVDAIGSGKWDHDGSCKIPETLHELRRQITEKDAEIERLRKIEDAAWNAVDTVPFSAHDIYQADARAMDNLSAVLEQNRGDNA